MTTPTRPRPPLRRAGTLLFFMLILLAMPSLAPAGNPEFTAWLPFVAAGPPSYDVTDEAGLIAAIARANTAADLPAIHIRNDITLTAPLPVLENPAPSLILIDGHGHALDGNETGPVLAIGPGTMVLIENLTIRNGWSECGGGLAVSGDVTVRDSTITGNRAIDGGGICVLGNAMPLHSETARLILESTAVSGNDAGRDGGGIFAASPATPEGQTAGSAIVRATSSRVANNEAGRDGGGIFAQGGPNNDATVTLTDVTVSGNEAGGRGGGAFTRTGSGSVTLWIIRSTVAGNRAASAGGLYNQGSTGFEWYSGGRAEVTIIESTLSGNVAANDGGAVFNLDVPEDGPGQRMPAVPPPIGGAYVNINYSTVAFNRAGRGGGVWESGRTWSLATIITGNEGGDCAGPGEVSSIGYTLDSDGSCGLGNPSDLPRGVADLRPLALNPPGTTATHALGPLSQARDRIPYAGVTGCGTGEPNPDQRRVARPQPAGGSCDIGSFEARPGE